MQQQLTEVRNQTTFVLGNEEILLQISSVQPLEPFAKETIEFLNHISQILLKEPLAKAYPDVITLAFWLRKSSMMQLKKRFTKEDEKNVWVGRGVIFHIAPSNVAVNYAYSLFTGLICGNCNVVRIPSKNFLQIEIINRAIAMALESNQNLVPIYVL